MGNRMIPPNYDYFGNKIANVIEVVIIDAILLGIIFKFAPGIRLKMYLMLFTMLPASVFGMIGINDQSLGRGLINYFKFLKNRRILTKPTADYMKALDKERLMKQKKEYGKGGKVDAD